MTIVSIVTGDVERACVLRHLATHPPKGLHVALLLYDFTALGIDPSIMLDSEEGDEDLDPMPLRLQNGTVCYGMIDVVGYVVALLKLCQLGRHDTIVLDLPPTDDIVGAIESIHEALTDHASEFPEPATIDAVICVLNQASFASDITSRDFLQDHVARTRGDRVEHLPSTLRVCEFLIDQVEAADVIVLEGTKQATSAQKEDALDMIAHINPEALLTEAREGYMDTSKVLQTKLFRADNAHCGWMKMLRGQFDAPSRGNVQHFVFNARRPFHPMRLWNLLKAANSSKNQLRTVFRSMGFVWLATRSTQYGNWSSAGPFFKIASGGVWYAAIPKSSWPSDPQSLADIKRDFCEDPIIGDRRQELVFIGKNLDQYEIESLIADCLLTDYEYNLGVEAWRRFPDPFEEWEVDLDLRGPGTGSSDSSSGLQPDDASVARALDLKGKRAD